MRTLRIVPDLRSSVVEEAPPDQALLFTSRRGDSDAALIEGNPAVLPFTWRRLRWAARDPDLELLEVAEPLWVGEWVRAVRCILLVKVLRALRPGRPAVTVATYAIENLDARESLGARARAGLAVSLLLLDAIVFGTSGAHENYRRAFGWFVARTRHAVLPPRVDVCSVCGPAAPDDDGTPRDPTVLFLGTPSERKGFDVLMRAWERSGGAGRGWRVVVADPDPAAAGDRDLPAGVSVRVAPSRREVHELLRTSAVVAMPSVRLPRWREQIGLPLVEGLAHGCRVVTTTETGLADDLAGHPRVVLTTPGDPQGLADGLRRAMEHDGAAAGRPREVAGYSKRDVVAWWLSSRRPG